MVSERVLLPADNTNADTTFLRRFGRRAAHEREFGTAPKISLRRFSVEWNWDSRPAPMLSLRY
jgi:hypothetical protein